MNAAGEAEGAERADERALSAVERVGERGRDAEADLRPLAHELRFLRRESPHSEGRDFLY